MKYLIKSHTDVITVPTAIREIYSEYEKIGYKMYSPVRNNTFAYQLEDGAIINVYWENGSFWEESRA